MSKRSDRPDSKTKEFRFSVEEVEHALRTSAGIYTLAAHKLACAPNTVRNYCRKYKSLAKVRDEEFDAFNDLAESQLYNGVLNKDHKSHTAFVQFRLKNCHPDYQAKLKIEGGTAGGAGKIAVYLPAEIPETDAVTQRVNEDGSANEGEDNGPEDDKPAADEPVDEPPDESEAKNEAPPPPPPDLPRRRRWVKGADGVERLEATRPEGDGAKGWTPPDED